MNIHRIFIHFLLKKIVKYYNKEKIEIISVGKIIIYQN